MGDEKAQDATDLRFIVAVRDKAHLDAAMRVLKRTASVLRVQRVRPGGAG
jgi:GTP pyrophosphokinase